MCHMSGIPVLVRVQSGIPVLVRVHHPTYLSIPYTHTHSYKSTIMTTSSNTENNSPEFSPSILHNKRGPLNPHNDSSRFTALMPKGLDLVLRDKRVLAVICLFLPPLAVFLKTGISRKFGLSLLLFAFFIFPGTQGAFIKQMCSVFNLL